MFRKKRADLRRNWRRQKILLQNNEPRRSMCCDGAQSFNVDCDYSIIESGSGS